MGIESNYRYIIVHDDEILGCYESLKEAQDSCDSDDDSILEITNKEWTRKTHTKVSFKQVKAYN